MHRGPLCLAAWPGPWVWLRNQGLRLNTDHLALEQIRWARETDPGDLVVIDAGYGNASQLRASITELGKLRNLQFGLEADFPGDACFAPTRVVFRPVLLQVTATPQPGSWPACRVTRSIGAPPQPNALPYLGKLVSSTIQALIAPVRSIRGSTISRTLANTTPSDHAP